MNHFQPNGTEPCQLPEMGLDPWDFATPILVTWEDLFAADLNLGSYDSMSHENICFPLWDEASTMATSTKVEQLSTVELPEATNNDIEMMDSTSFLPTSLADLTNITPRGLACSNQNSVDNAGLPHDASYN